ncbi:MAG TPA: XRE family transcriptional regulator [Actinobacteria bacterium]|nr:XRE family transcriptional regulator [Actinomycetota bacterium]
MPAGSEGPTVRLRRLGMELRVLREAAGLNSQQAADELGCSQSKISRVETGKSPVSVRDVRDLLGLYAVTDEEQRERLLGLARDSRQRGWWAEFGSWLPSGFDTYAGMEAATASVRAYQAQLVHGLLQTEDYARALLRALRVEDTRESVEKLVEFRMARQAQLTRAENPLRLWVIFEEEVLKRPVGGPAVMQAQLQRILEAAEEPTITIQVLPTARGAHAGLDGSFSVFEFPDPGDPDVAYVGGPIGTVFVEKIEDVRRFATRFDHLRAAALDIGESADLIATTARGM